MRASDQMLARLGAEIEQQQTFQDKLLEDAEKDGRDLTDNEMELFTRSRDRLQALNTQIEPVKESRRISHDSQNMIADLAKYLQDETKKPAGVVEYRSAGAYILDYWRAGLGMEEARDRISTFDRAAAHQTTGDNPGLLPTPMVEPVINFIDSARPLVSAFPRPQAALPSGTFNRPKISQHTDVAPQTAEKTELVSRKMIIGMVPVTAKTYGGYVNVSRQNIDWSQPQIMDLVINDLAGVYAQETEKALCAAVDAATTAGPVIPTGPATPAAVNSAIWAAAGTVYASSKGAGRVIIACSPDTLGLLGPRVPGRQPDQRDLHRVLGVRHGARGTSGRILGATGRRVRRILDAGTMIVLSTAAVEVYEDRVGSLQVVEPSVLGVQVAYAGYFAEVIIDAGAIVEITKMRR